MTTVKFCATAAGGQAAWPGAAAWAAAQLGLRVFPLTAAGLPAFKGWPDIASAAPDVLQEWWSGEFAGAGYGIACGPESDVWVLDVDVKDGRDGFRSLRAVAYGHGDTGTLLRRTMCVATPSGGAHLYFRWSEGVVNSTGRLGVGLDVRAHHGYVRGPGWGGYQVVPRGSEGLRPTGRISAPAWLVERAQKRRSDRASEALTEVRPGTSWSAYSTTLTLAALAAAPVGTRNVQLNKAAYKMGRNGSMSMEEAWNACRSVIERMGAADGMNAWRRTFESGWNAGVAQRGSA